MSWWWTRAPAIGGGFNPAALAGMELWVQSDLGVTIETGVSEWENQVEGNTWGNLLQATTTKQPAVVTSWSPSGKSGIQGDSTDDILALASQQSLGVKDWSQFFVWGQGGTWDYMGGSGDTSWSWRYNGNYQLSGSISTGDPYDTTGKPAAIVECYCAPSTGAITIYQNGVDVTAAGPPTKTTEVFWQQIGGRTLVLNPDSCYTGVWGVASVDLSAQRSAIYDWLSDWSGVV